MVELGPPGNSQRAGWGPTAHLGPAGAPSPLSGPETYPGKGVALGKGVSVGLGFGKALAVILTGPQVGRKGCRGGPHSVPEVPFLRPCGQLRVWGRVWWVTA